jgi:hypothetical protein
MNKFGIGTLAAAALLTCVALISPAQARWAPSGSYESTCTNVRYDGDTLTASCRRPNGTWKNTWLPNADNCDGNIVNDNGQLECAGYHGRDWYRYNNDGGPSGSYESTCTNIRMDGYTLKATCQRLDGSWRWSELEDAYDCDGHIANYNGRLVCRGGRY